MLDPRRVPEAFFALADGIYFFFVTIISYEAASTWLASRKKKNDDLPGVLPAHNDMCPSAQHGPQQK